jgi:hypothetical protein
MQGKEKQRGVIAIIAGLVAASLLLGGTISSRAQEPGGANTVPNTHLEYGMVMALLGNNAEVRAMGYDWVQYGAYWKDAEPSPNTYNWGHVDNIIRAADEAGISVLIRISRPPEWARDPAAVLLDEPTRGMDRLHKDALATRIQRLADAGSAVMVATHDTEFAAALADRIILLGQGVVIADGEPKEVLGGGRHFSTEVARVTAGAALLPEEGAEALGGRSGLKAGGEGQEASFNAAVRGQASGAAVEDEPHTAEVRP